MTWTQPGRSSHCFKHPRQDVSGKVGPLRTRILPHISGSPYLAVNDFLPLRNIKYKVKRSRRNSFQTKAHYNLAPLYSKKVKGFSFSQGQEKKSIFFPYIQFKSCKHTSLSTRFSSTLFPESQLLSYKAPESSVLGYHTIHCFNHKFSIYRTIVVKRKQGLSGWAPYKQLKAHSLKGILLVNFPEKEKNFLIKNLAAENKIPLITQSASLLLKDSRNMDDLLGVDDPIQVLFDKVKASVPCICFINDLDSIGKQRHEQELRHLSLSRSLSGWDREGGTGKVLPSESFFLSSLIPRVFEQPNDTSKGPLPPQIATNSSLLRFQKRQNRSSPGLAWSMPALIYLGYKDQREQQEGNGGGGYNKKRHRRVGRLAFKNLKVCLSTPLPRQTVLALTPLLVHPPVSCPRTSGKTLFVQRRETAFPPSQPFGASVKQNKRVGYQRYTKTSPFKGGEVQLFSWRKAPMVLSLSGPVWVHRLPFWMGEGVKGPKQPHTAKIKTVANTSSQEKLQEKKNSVVDPPIASEGSEGTLESQVPSETDIIKRTALLKFLQILDGFSTPMSFSSAGSWLVFFGRGLDYPKKFPAGQEASPNLSNLLPASSRGSSRNTLLKQTSVNSFQPYGSSSAAHQPPVYKDSILSKPWNKTKPRFFSAGVRPVTLERLGPSKKGENLSGSNPFRLPFQRTKILLGSLKWETYLKNQPPLSLNLLCVWPSYIDDILGSSHADDIGGSPLLPNYFQLVGGGHRLKSGIMVIASTNSLTTLDAALLRPGRFDTIINFSSYPNPTKHNEAGGGKESDATGKGPRESKPSRLKSLRSTQNGLLLPLKQLHNNHQQTIKKFIDVSIFVEYKLWALQNTQKNLVQDSFSQHSSPFRSFTLHFSRKEPSFSSMYAIQIMRIFIHEWLNKIWYLLSILSLQALKIVNHKNLPKNEKKRKGFCFSNWNTSSTFSPTLADSTTLKNSQPAFLDSLRCSEALYFSPWLGSFVYHGCISNPNHNEGVNGEALGFLKEYRNLLFCVGRFDFPRELALFPQSVLEKVLRFVALHNHPTHSYRNENINKIKNEQIKEHRLVKLHQPQQTPRFSRETLYNARRPILASRANARQASKNKTQKKMGGGPVLLTKYNHIYQKKREALPKQPSTLMSPPRANYSQPRATSAFLPEKTEARGPTKFRSYLQVAMVSSLDLLPPIKTTKNHKIDILSNTQTTKPSSTLRDSSAYHEKFSSTNGKDLPASHKAFDTDQLVSKMCRLDICFSLLIFYARWAQQEEPYPKKIILSTIKISAPYRSLIFSHVLSSLKGGRIPVRGAGRAILGREPRNLTHFSCKNFEILVYNKLKKYLLNL